MNDRVELQTEVRKDPGNAKLRVFLFQLLCVLGDWDRARDQLKVLADLDAGSLALVHVYGAAVSCEELRRDVFAGARTPLVLGEPLPWLALLFQALATSGPDAAVMRCVDVLLSIPALLLAMHIPGHTGLEKDEFMLAAAERYAAHGYVVAVPFIFHWWPKQAELQLKRDESRDDRMVLDLAAALSLL